MAWTTPATATAGSTALTAAFWNTNVRDNTNELYGSLRCFGYQERTTAYTASSTTGFAGAADIFTTAITFTAVAATAYRLEFYCPSLVVPSGAWAAVAFGNGSTQLGYHLQDGTAGRAIHAVQYYTPGAGSVSINVRAYRNASNCTLEGGTGVGATNVPMWFAVFGPRLT